MPVSTLLPPWWYIFFADMSKNSIRKIKYFSNVSAFFTCLHLTHLPPLSQSKSEYLTSLCQLSVSMTRVRCLHPHRTDCLLTRTQTIIKDQQTLDIYLSWTNGRRSKDCFCSSSWKLISWSDKLENQKGLNVLIYFKRDLKDNHVIYQSIQKYIYN